MIMKLILSHWKKYHGTAATVSFFVLAYLLYISGTIDHGTTYFYHDQVMFVLNESHNDTSLRSRDSEVCRIPDVNPYHPTILRYLKAAPPISCSRHLPLTYTTSEGGRQVLRVDKAMVTNYAPSFKSLDCCYSVVTRVSDDTNKESNCFKFDHQAILDLEVEFILVRCQDKQSKKQVYVNMHALVQINPEKNLTTKDNVSKTGITDTLPNVLLLGIDSISRLNLKRTMLRTVNYLRSNSWVELRKYNKIGDNTLPNLMAVLTGQNTTQLGEIRCTHLIKNTMDHCPFIWKDFKQKGYVTAYAEDEPKIGTFNYNARGFFQPPTDYYFRPFMVEAMHKLPLKTRDSQTICLGPTSTTDHFLKYAKDLLSAFNNSLFALIWMNNFSHNNFNTPAAMDQRILEFMQDLKSSGSLNNTMVVFFSDHGTRFGDIRKTYVGWLEERLPFIYIWVPSWYREKYPDAYQNLIDNGDRLTSPYDMHLLLKDVVDDSVGMAGNGSEGCSTCVSLFAPVSRTRSCDDAGITPHWCTCASQIQTSTTGSVVQSATKFIISEIEQKLAKQQNGTNVKCALLKLNNIVNARLKEKSNQSHKDVDGYDDYVIVFDTLPGLGMFDSTVRYWPNNKKVPFKIMGFISRINSYAQHSECMHDNELKLYCYCLKP